MVEDFCDKTFPRRDFVRCCSALPSDHDFIRARSFRGCDSRGSRNRQKEKQRQENEEAKSIEGASRQSQPKACLARISWNTHLWIVANGQGHAAVSLRLGTPIS